MFLGKAVNNVQLFLWWSFAASISNILFISLFLLSVNNDGIHSSLFIFMRISPMVFWHNFCLFISCPWEITKLCNIHMLAPGIHYWGLDPLWTSCLRAEIQVFLCILEILFIWFLHNYLGGRRSIWVPDYTVQSCLVHLCKLFVMRRKFYW